MKKILSLFISILFLSGCSINLLGNNNVQPSLTNQNLNEQQNINAPINIGGPCQYNNIAGIAKILSIESAPDNGNNCPVEPKLIKFTFTPDDQNIKSSESELRINAGTNPSLKWIDDQKIAVGNIYRVERQEITSGTCTPRVYKFLDLDLFPSNGCN